MEKIFDTIIIGGGQAGLAAGYYAQKYELAFTILEAGDRPVGSWPKYYDSLRLFSPARYSSLPGMEYPKGSDTYPKRDEVITYLEKYAQYFNLPIQTNQTVITVVKDHNGIFIVNTTDGHQYRTRTIINATGSFNNPYIPEIKNHHLYKGMTLHSALYRNPRSVRGKRVVVVGRGNSAVQIAIELSSVASVTMAVLHPVQLIPQTILGKDVHFWLKITGFDTFPFWRFKRLAPKPHAAIDLGDYKSKLSKSQPNQKPMFNEFYENGVVWQNGEKESIDTVLFATGYGPDYNYLHNLGALDSLGRPLQLGGASTTVSNLYYVGLEGQRSYSSATLRGVGPDAKYVIGQIYNKVVAKRQ